MTLLIEFDRIGRNHSVPPLRVQQRHTGADYVAREVHRYAGKFLGSRWYDVHAELPWADRDGKVHDGTVSIEYGRFGRGTIKVQELVPS